MSIIIDGMAGAGKSNLVSVLANKGFQPFYEPVVDNPFLEKFYADRSRYAFASQIFFLLNGFKFTKEAGFEPNVVIDRSVFGHAVFARMLKLEGALSPEEYTTYQELYNTLVEEVPPPQLLVYLDAETDTIMDRIKRRGREFEINVEREYWEKLNRECRRYFLEEYFHSPKIVIKTDNLDLINSPDDIFQVVEKIKKML